MTRRSPSADRTAAAILVADWVFEPFTNSLGEEDIQFIKDHLGEWLAEQSLRRPPAVYEIELRERMVRVEEELKNQRELIKALIEQMDKRFEALTQRVDRFMIWSFTLTLSVGALIVAALKVWP